jgi:hypothetical protein
MRDAVLKARTEELEDEGKLTRTLEEARAKELLGQDETQKLIEGVEQARAARRSARDHLAGRLALERRYELAHLEARLASQGQLDEDRSQTHLRQIRPGFREVGRVNMRESAVSPLVVSFGGGNVVPNSDG